MFLVMMKVKVCDIARRITWESTPHGKEGEGPAQSREVEGERGREQLGIKFKSVSGSCKTAFAKSDGMDGKKKACISRSLTLVPPETGSWQKSPPISKSK